MMRQQQEQEQEIYLGSRGDDFKNMIQNILKKGKLKPKYIKYLTDKEAMKIFDKIFTAITANPNYNYEVFETLGDPSANKFIVWYAYRKFPQLDCVEGVKILSRIKVVFGSKEIFGDLGIKLGFWPFISASVEERSRRRKDLNEDVFEAFIGAVEYLIDNRTRVGVGYAIVRDILESIFNEHINISLKYEDLVDSVTILKELFDSYEDLGKNNLDYTHETIEVQGSFNLTCVRVIRKLSNGRKEILAEETGPSKFKTLKKPAAKKAIDVLESRGYRKKIPPEYEFFSMFEKNN